MNVYRILKLIRFWPPYLGAGIYIRSFEKPLNQIVVGMKLSRRNTNYVGTHFGGNLYSLCDPWFMFILMHHLGADYTVWDKAASIDFIKPGLARSQRPFLSMKQPSRPSEPRLIEAKRCSPSLRSCSR